MANQTVSLGRNELGQPSVPLHNYEDSRHRMWDEINPGKIPTFQFNMVKWSTAPGSISRGMIIAWRLIARRHRKGAGSGGAKGRRAKIQRKSERLTWHPRPLFHPKIRLNRNRSRCVAINLASSLNYHPLWPPILADYLRYLALN